MDNIQKVSDSYMCSNCGACKSICPKEAIDFKWSSMGRMYAYVNDKCIDCGLCTKVCPSINDAANLFEDPYVGHIEALYTGKATDDAIFRNAQSGGAVTAVLTYLFEKKDIDCAVVCRMKAGDTPIVESALITNASELVLSQKSCYTPVDMLSILKKAKDFKSVAVVGLPCHIEGLLLLQAKSKRFQNVKYKLGLICDRTLCSSIQDLLVGKYANAFNEKNVKIDWRRKFLNNKVFQYKTAPVVIYSEQDEYTVPNNVRFFLKEPFTPPRCRVCSDKINVMADLVFGDPWRMTNIDWVKGESVIIARTAFGNELLKEMKNNGALQLNLRKTEEIITGQLIPQRREQVALWKEAIKVLPLQLESYIVQSSQPTVPIDEKLLAAAQSKLNIFIKMESLPKSKAVEIIKKDVDKFEKRIKSPFYRLITRVVNKLRSILKR